MTRKLFLVIFIMIFAIYHTEAQWEKANGGKELPDNTGISAIITNGNTIVAATTAGIYLSTNNGENWTQKNTGLTDPTSITELCQKGNLIFAANMETVYISSDNGNNWIQKDNGLEGESIYSFLVVGNNIYTGTSGGVYLLTNDGDNWIHKSQGIPEYESVNAMAIKSNIIFAGTSVGVYASTNNGDNWTKKNFSDVVYSISANNNFIFFSGEGYHTGIKVSSDNGSSWNNRNEGLDIEHDTHYFLISIGDSVFAGGTNTGVYMTTDNGQIWTPNNDGLSDYVRQNELMLALNEKYVLVGSKGRNGFCNLWRLPRVVEPPDTQAVNDNYNNSNILGINPNPASDKINITYDLLKDEKINLTICDLLGNKILVVSNEFKNKGMNTEMLSASQFQEGTYFLRLMTPDFTIIKTFVIIR